MSRMQPKQISLQRMWRLLPLAASILYVMLYLWAASLYPGGSQADAHSKGFSWLHNYWCNLLTVKAINGETNAGRGIAEVAMAMLAVAFISFGFFAAQVLFTSKPIKRLVQIAGVLCMVPLIFLSSNLHDVMLMVTAVFGLVGMTVIYVAFYRRGWYLLLALGLFNYLLIGLNNYIYYVSSTRYWLPLVQKITFLSFLLWICFSSVALYRQPPGVA